MLAIGNTALTGANGTKVSEIFGPMEAQGVVHDNGWGLMYYVNSIYGAQVVVEYYPDFISRGPLWRYSTSAAYSESAIDAAIQEIRFGGYSVTGDDDRSDEVSCAIGHIRLASSGCGTGAGEEFPPDPHPFIITLDDGTTYAFAHNGTLDKDVLRDLITDDWMKNNNFIPQTYPNAGCGGDWYGDGWEHVIDSELYFFWIMKNILKEPAGDVLRGINKALHEHDFLALDGAKNFILSDGDEIWSYRYDPSRDSSSPDYNHTIYWKYDASDNYAAIMSQTSGDGWHLLGNDALIYIPKSGKPVLIEDFANLDGIERKKLHNGINWVGFPVLADNDNTPVATALEYLVDPDDPFNPVNELYLQSRIDGAAGWRPGGGWYPTDLQYLNSIEGYKLDIAHDDYSKFYMPVQGGRIPVDTEINLEAGPNWVDYFAVRMQPPSVALPQQVLDHLISIQAELWFMIYRDGEFYVKKECQDPIEGEYRECYNMVYGDMYILNMEEPVTFTWNVPTFPVTPPDSEYQLVPDSFAVRVTDSYLPVVIDTIETDATVTEIGAFKGGECVGAEVVDGYPVNLKLYSSDVTGVTYEIVTDQASGNAKAIADRSSSYQQVEPVRQTYERGAVFMTLSIAADEAAEPVPANFTIVQVYPNPFNPVTQIRFDLGAEASVALTIYDLTGRKVKTVVDGVLNAGDHTFTWNGRNAANSPLASGIYIYRLTDRQTTVSGKIICLK